MRAIPRPASQSRRFRAWLGLASIAIVPVLAACGDVSHPLAPDGSQSPAYAVAAGATKSHVEGPIAVDQVAPLCPGSNDLAHFVWTGTFTFDWTTTSSGVSNGRFSIGFDRSLSYVEYNGVTYHFVNSHPERDLLEHFLIKPDGMYVEVGVFLDFERSDTGVRLNTQATFVMVIDPNGNVRLDGVNHGVFTSGNCGPVR